MFEIGFWEIMLILVLALLVLGPERLPGAARTVGHWVGKMRRYVEGVKNEVEREFDASEMKRILHNQEVQIRELQSKINEPVDFMDDEYHKKFDNAEDPGTASAPQYEILEEDDDAFPEPENSIAPPEKKEPDL